MAKERKKTAKDRVLNILLIFFILVFLGSGGYLAHYYYGIYKGESSYSELADLIDESAGTDTSDGASSAPEMVNAGNDVYLLKKYARLYEKNNDFIGWIKIDNTKIDYPVMQTPDDPEHYLRRDFNGDYLLSGCIFADARCSISEPQSDNIIIYGHHMKAGNMFASLEDYMDEDYYKQHNIIHFDTIYEMADYEVIAAGKTKIESVDYTGFKYYQFTDAENREEFDDFVANVKAMTPYNISETAEYGDKLITLSTCSYHVDNGRMIVVARKIEK